MTLRCLVKCLLYHCSVGKNLFLFRHRAKLAGLPQITVQIQGGAEEGHEVKFVNGTAIQNLIQKTGQYTEKQNEKD